MNSLNDFLNKIVLSVVILAGFIFPIIVLPVMTDPFILPKQIVVFAAVILILLITGVKLLSGEDLKLRRTPFDLPLLGFSLVLVLSSLLSVNRADSAIIAISILSLVLFYYAVINTLKKDVEIDIFMLSAVVGVALSSVISLLSFAKVYLFFTIAKNVAFNSFGSILTLALFLLVFLPAAVALTLSSLRKNKLLTVVFTVSTLVILAGFLLSVYQLFVPPSSVATPTLLPHEYSLQAATGSIGQNFQTLLFGSGPGTFLTDFSRFRSANFNNLPIWGTVFFTASSLFLEFLATTGLLGVGFFLLLLLTILRSFQGNPPLGGERLHLGLFISLALFAVLSFILPLGFPLLYLFVVILALYTLSLVRVAPKLVYDTKISVINLQEGLSLRTNVVSLILVAVSFILAGVGGYFGYQFTLGDFKFQKSLVTAQENKALETYNLQRESIGLSPYRDGFRRGFSQTNLALANSLAQNIRASNASPSAGQQQTLLQLVQQSINNAQAATALGPQNFFNWDNLGAVYRALMGFGQNAESFAVTSASQAVTLYPTNPQLRLSLGGVYYQLGQWDQAQRQFELAVQLKPDLANAYYNLGHALENKGELARALAQYQASETLIAQAEKDSDNHKRIMAEIEALKERISREGATVAAVSQPTLPAQPGRQAQQEPLRVSTPSATLPSQKQKVEIPAPPIEATKSAQ